MIGATMFSRGMPSCFFGFLSMGFLCRTIKRWHRWGGGERRNGMASWSYGKHGRQSSPSGCPAAPSPLVVPWLCSWCLCSGCLNPAGCVPIAAEANIIKLVESPVRCDTQTSQRSVDGAVSAARRGRNLMAVPKGDCCLCAITSEILSLKIDQRSVPGMISEECR